MDASVYMRPNKPLYGVVKKRRRDTVVANVHEVDEPMFVDRSTECHTTPDDVAKRMVEYLNPFYGKVLEPSAGTGKLICALLDSGVSPLYITAVEKHCQLSVSLRENIVGNVEIHNMCFLEFAQKNKGVFSHILMNPPFKRCKQHINTALSLLNDSDESSMVILVPDSYNHPLFEEVEKLPENTFALANVHTKIMVLNR